MTLELHKASFTGTKREYEFGEKGLMVGPTIHVFTDENDRIVKITTNSYEDEGLSQAQLFKKYRSEARSIMGTFRHKLGTTLNAYKGMSASREETFTEKDSVPACPLRKDPAKQEYYNDDRMFRVEEGPNSAALFALDRDNNGTTDMISFSLLYAQSESMLGYDHRVQVSISSTSAKTAPNGYDGCTKVDTARTGVKQYLALFDHLFAK